MKPEYSSLGYRGIRVDLDATEFLTAFKGLIEVVSGDEVRRFMDYNREFEEWIFYKTSLGRVEDAIYNRAECVSEFHK